MEKGPDGSGRAQRAEEGHGERPRAMDARENHLGKFYLFSPSLRLGTTTYIQESIEGKHVG